MERMSEHTGLISSYQLLITAACTNTAGKMKGSHPRAADRCPFVPRHRHCQVTSFMHLGMLCTPETMLPTESRKSKNQIWPPGGHFDSDVLIINRLLPMTTINMYMKFEIEIPQQTWLMLRKPCRLQTDGRTDGRTRWIQYTPPSNSLGGGIIKLIHTW